MVRYALEILYFLQEFKVCPTFLRQVVLKGVRLMVRVAKSQNQPECFKGNNSKVMGNSQGLVSRLYFSEVVI